jgi:hypothetical protein
MHSYPLQQTSKAGAVVRVAGTEVDPVRLERDLMPICKALSRLVRDSPPEVRDLEVSLSITPSGEIAFLRSTAEAALKIRFQRVG